MTEQPTHIFVTIDGAEHAFGTGRAWTTGAILDAVGIDPRPYELARGEIRNGNFVEAERFHAGDNVWLRSGDVFLSVRVGPWGWSD